MSFIWPIMLFSLLSIPLLVALYIRIQHGRRRLAANYGGLELMQGSAGQRVGFHRHIPAALFFVGLTVLMLALARPQTVVGLTRVMGTVILAFDVSGSMAADDLKPTRMEAAKVAARDFVQHQPSTVQVGVVAFSDSGFSVQAPTDDQKAIFDSINRLTPQRGTSLAQGILASLKAMEVQAKPLLRLYTNLTPAPIPTSTPMPDGDYTSTVIVLFTDGENNISPDPLAAAREAANRGVRIYTVGIGSTEGATLNIDGFLVHTQLDEAMLQQISRLTGGAYYHAAKEEDLQKIYEDLILKMVVKPEKTEVTSIFAGASIFILLVGGIFSLLWFGRLP